MEKELVKEYEINPFTIMIKPLIQGDQLFSEIFELEDTYITPEQPTKIVKRSCKYFGSSFEGRREATRQLINTTHKAPIIVDPHTSIYLFPTTSPANPECIWISHDQILSHRKGDNSTTVVAFQNNEEYIIPISLSSFVTQMSRTANLRIKYQQNIDRMEMYRQPMRQSFYLHASEFHKPYRTD